MGKPRRIFLDANILFSAAKSAGAVRELLGDLHADGARLVVDAYVTAEARRNIAIKADAASQRYLEALLNAIETATAYPQMQDDQFAHLVGWLPEKDRPVLRAAIASRCDALVTGDRKDFGSGFGRSFGGVVIYAPAQLVLSVWPDAWHLTILN